MFFVIILQWVTTEGECQGTTSDFLINGVPQAAGCDAISVSGCVANCASCIFVFNYYYYSTALSAFVCQDSVGACDARGLPLRKRYSQGGLLKYFKCVAASECPLAMLELDELTGQYVLVCQISCAAASSCTIQHTTGANTFQQCFGYPPNSNPVACTADYCAPGAPSDVLYVAIENGQCRFGCSQLKPLQLTLQLVTGFRSAYSCQSVCTGRALAGGIVTASCPAGCEFVHRATQICLPSCTGAASGFNEEVLQAGYVYRCYGACPGGRYQANATYRGALWCVDHCVAPYVYEQKLQLIVQCIDTCSYVKPNTFQCVTCGAIGDGFRIRNTVVECYSPCPELLNNDMTSAVLGIKECRTFDQDCPATYPFWGPLIEGMYECVSSCPFVGQFDAICKSCIGTHVGYHLKLVQGQPAKYCVEECRLINNLLQLDGVGMCYNSDEQCPDGQSLLNDLQNGFFECASSAQPSCKFLYNGYCQTTCSFGYMTSMYNGSLVYSCVDCHLQLRQPGYLYNSAGLCVDFCPPAAPFRLLYVPQYFECVSDKTSCRFTTGENYTCISQCLQPAGFQLVIPHIRGILSNLDTMMCLNPCPSKVLNKPQWSLTDFECVDSCPDYNNVYQAVGNYFICTQTCLFISTQLIGSTLANVCMTSCDLPNYGWQQLGQMYQCIECQYLSAVKYSGANQCINKCDAITPFKQPIPGYNSFICVDSCNFIEPYTYVCVEACSLFYTINQTVSGISYHICQLSCPSKFYDSNLLLQFQSAILCVEECEFPKIYKKQVVESFECVLECQFLSYQDPTLCVSCSTCWKDNECYTTCPLIDPESTKLGVVKLVLKCPNERPFRNNGICVSSCTFVSVFQDSYYCQADCQEGQGWKSQYFFNIEAKICVNCKIVNPLDLYMEYQHCIDECPIERRFLLQVNEQLQMYQCTDYCTFVEVIDSKYYCSKCPLKMFRTHALDGINQNFCETKSCRNNEILSILGPIGRECLQQCPTSQPYVQFNSLLNIFTCINSCPYIRQGICLNSCILIGSTTLLFGIKTTECLDDCYILFKQQIGFTCTSNCPDGYSIIKRSINGKQQIMCIESCLFYDQNNNCIDSCSTSYQLRDNRYYCIQSCTLYNAFNTYQSLPECVEQCPDLQPFINDQYCTDECNFVSYEAQNMICVSFCIAGYTTQSLDNGIKMKLCSDCTFFEVNFGSFVCLQTQCQNYAIQIQKQYKCVVQCDDYVQDQNGLNVCVNACQSYISVQNQILKCVQQCPANYFVANSVCVVQCPSEQPFIQILAGVATCVSTCEFTNDQKQCQSDCPFFDYIFLNGNFVKKCIVKCDLVDNAIIVAGSSQCVQTCPPQRPFKKFNVRYECVSSCQYATLDFYCVLSCLPYVVNSGVRMCQDCLLVYQDQCVQFCPQEAPFKTVSGAAAMCTSTCIFVNNVNECISCVTYYKPIKILGISSNLCYNACPDMNYADSSLVVGSAKQCVQQCIFVLNGECVNQCANNKYYVIDDQKVCSICSLYRYVDGNKLCLNECLHGVINGEECYSGNDRCNHFRQSIPPAPYEYSGNCVQTCINFYIYDSLTLLRTCIDTCPTFYLQQVDEYLNTVRQCVENCAPLFTSSLTFLGTLACSAVCDAFLDGKMCKQSCPDGIYRNSICISLEDIVQRKQPCEFVTNGVNGQYQCLDACAAGSKFLQLNFSIMCLPECPETVPYLVQNVCTRYCPNKSHDSDLICTSCAKFFTLTDNGHHLCVDNCNSQPLMNSQCVASSDCAFTARIGEAVVCVQSCPNLVMNGQCVDVCQLNQVNVNGQCVTKCTDQFERNGMCVSSCSQYDEFNSNRGCVTKCQNVQKLGRCVDAFDPVSFDDIIGISITEQQTAVRYQFGLIQYLVGGASIIIGIISFVLCKCVQKSMHVRLELPEVDEEEVADEEAIIADMSEDLERDDVVEL